LLSLNLNFCQGSCLEQWQGRTANYNMDIAAVVENEERGGQFNGRKKLTISKAKTTNIMCLRPSKKTKAEARVCKFTRI
jgi:hypothetical protein